MSHRSVRLLIEETAKKLGDDIHFTYGRTSDFNVLRGKRYPFITLDPLTSNASFAANNSYNFTKTWSVLMAFYQLDKEHSIEKEYALILDEMDKLVDQFIIKLNFYNDNSEVGSIIIQSVNQEPFIKAMADVLTGYSLSFQITVPDNWNYCGDC